MIKLGVKEGRISLILGSGTDMKKQCSKCLEFKDISEFGAHSGTRLRGNCKGCVKLHRKEYYKANSQKVKASSMAAYKANPRKSQNARLKRKFGISIEQYDEMLKNQDGRCAICETHRSWFRQAFAVDHNHKTGKIRGLLCAACNTAIGKLKEDLEIIRRAMIYLQK